MCQQSLAHLTVVASRTVPRLLTGPLRFGLRRRWAARMALWVGTVWLTTLGAAANPAPPELSCAAATDLANAAELHAATLTSQRAEPGKIQAALDIAIGHWRQALTACKDRAAERAHRNLTEALKLRAEVQEQSKSAEQCEAPQGVARSFQELAKAAMSDRRFSEAAALFSKAEGSWDLATERCSGSVRQAAQGMRDQSALHSRQAEAMAKERRTAPSASAAVPIAKETPPSTARPAASAASSEAMPGTPMGTPQPTASALTANVAASSATKQSVDALAAAAMKPIDTRLADGTRVTGLLAWDNTAKGYTGRGRFDWPNGDIYDGDMLRGLRHGQGKFIWRNGQEFVGQWMNGKAIGQGTLKLSNGDVYEGSIEDGVPDGSGAMRYASGDHYLGDIRQGQPHGKGVYTWVNTQRCDCVWVNGVAMGVGKLTYANGNQYQGALAAGQPEGKGQLNFATGEVYQGTFVAGEFDGEGTYRWPNGDEYVGGWKAGRKEGRGAMTWSKGERWEGTYKNDEQAEGQLIRRLKRRPSTAGAAGGSQDAAPAAATPAASASAR